MRTGARAGLAAISEAVTGRAPCPADGLRAVVAGRHQVSGADVFDQAVARRGADQGSCGKAGYRQVEDRRAEGNGRHIGIRGERIGRQDPDAAQGVDAVPSGQRIPGRAEEHVAVPHLDQHTVLSRRSAIGEGQLIPDRQKAGDGAVDRLPGLGRGIHHPGIRAIPAPAVAVIGGRESLDLLAVDGDRAAVALDRDGLDLGGADGAVSGHAVRLGIGRGRACGGVHLRLVADPHPCDDRHGEPRSP